jgi:hypothetical protein
VLGEGRDPDPALLQLLADLAGSPGIERDLGDREPLGQLADHVGNVEHRPIAGEDLDADVQAVVDPDDGAVGTLPADIDADHDPLAVLEHRLAGARLPRADREPVVLGFGPLIGEVPPEGGLGEPLALLAKLLDGDPWGWVRRLHTADRQLGVLRHFPAKPPDAVCTGVYDRPSALHPTGKGTGSKAAQGRVGAAGGGRGDDEL